MNKERDLLLSLKREDVLLSMLATEYGEVVIASDEDDDYSTMMVNAINSLLEMPGYQEDVQDIAFDTPTQAEVDEPLLRWFSAAHLPPMLRGMMEAYRNMAVTVVNALPRSPERTLAIRALIESKDNAIRGLVDLSRLVPNEGSGDRNG